MAIIAPLSVEMLAVKGPMADAEKSNQEPKPVKPAKSNWIAYVTLRVIAEGFCWLVAIAGALWGIVQVFRLTELLGVSSVPPGLLYGQVD